MESLDPNFRCECFGPHRSATTHHRIWELLQSTSCFVYNVSAVKTVKAFRQLSDLQRLQKSGQRKRLLTPSPLRNLNGEIFPLNFTCSEQASVQNKLFNRKYTFERLWPAKQKDFVRLVYERVHDRQPFCWCQIIWGDPIDAFLLVLFSNFKVQRLHSKYLPKRETFERPSNASHFLLIFRTDWLPNTPLCLPAPIVLTQYNGIDYYYSYNRSVLRLTSG